MKDIDDVVYEVDCRKVTKGGEQFDVGGNPSAEEAEDALDEGTKQVIDVVDGFRLQFLGDEESGTRAFATKKDFQGQFKGMVVIEFYRALVCRQGLTSNLTSLSRYRLLEEGR